MLQEWADFYYQLADKVVGLSIIALLFVLTMLPLATLQSTILFKASFGKVLARRRVLRRMRLQRRCCVRAWVFCSCHRAWCCCALPR